VYDQFDMNHTILREGVNFNIHIYIYIYICMYIYIHIYIEKLTPTFSPCGPNSERFESVPVKTMNPIRHSKSRISKNRFVIFECPIGFIVFTRYQVENMECCQKQLHREVSCGSYAYIYM
jgi:hypothetical protein